MKIEQIILITIFTLGQLLCIGQINQPNEESERVQLKSMYDSRLYVFKPDDKLLEIDTTAGKGIIIQNSLPKGDRYFHPNGKSYGCATFWSRVINETDTPITLSINFSADSFPIALSPDTYLKLFLLPDTMSLDKESLYNYGATGMYSFLDACLNESTSLQKTLNPMEEYIFYIGVLSHQLGGMIRTCLVLKEEGLFYRISILPDLEPVLFSCGSIVVKE